MGLRDVVVVLCVQFGALVALALFVVQKWSDSHCHLDARARGWHVGGLKHRQVRGKATHVEERTLRL